LLAKLRQWKYFTASAQSDSALQNILAGHISALLAAIKQLEAIKPFTSLP
jgi:hypothetical protein